MRVPANYTNTVINIMTEKIKVEESNALSTTGIYIEIDMSSKGISK